MGVEYPSELPVHNSFFNIPQYDGSDSITNNSVNNSDTDDTLVSEFDSEDEIDIELPRFVLKPQQDGVDAPQIQTNDSLDILSLPLFLVLNARSVRQKIQNLKTTINTINAMTINASRKCQKVIVKIKLV